MKKLGFLLASMLMLCASQASAQVYASTNTATQLTLNGKTENYNYKSTSVTLYLDTDNRTLKFYFKPYTFVMDETNTEAKTLLINALAMNNDNAGEMAFKASLPADFKMPKNSKRAKVTLTGDLKIAGKVKRASIPVTIQSDAKNTKYTCSLDATLDLKTLGVELSQDVTEKTTGLVHLKLSDAVLSKVNISKK